MTTQRYGVGLALAAVALLFAQGCQTSQLPQRMETPGAAASPGEHSPPTPTMLALRRNLLNPEVESLFLRNMDELFETRTVAHGREAFELSSSAAPLPTYEFQGQTRSYADFAERTNTNAFLIVHDGRITFEDYRNRSTAATRFASFSMAKSVTSILIGIAVERGLIASIDDPVVNYVPELRGSGYDGVSLRNILQMRSGVAYEERYDFGANPSLAAIIHEQAVVRNIERFADRARTVTRAAEPGARFNYATLDTAVLGWALENAAHRSMADLTSEWLWKPAGMERDGFWIADGPVGVGRELSGMGFNATLRDYARIGLLMLNGGKVDGRQVIPPDWVRQSTQMTAFDGPSNVNFGVGYGFQWWQVDDNPGAFSAVGLAGQFIYVAPQSRTVIVKLSYFPVANEGPMMAETLAFFRAVANQNASPATTGTP